MPISSRMSGVTKSSALNGARVVLRPVEPTDLPAFIALFEASGMEEWWPGEDREKLAREHIEPEDDDVTVYAVVVDGAVMGLIQSWEETEPEYRHAGIDIALHPDTHEPVLRRRGAPPCHHRPGGAQRPGDPLLREGRFSSRRNHAQVRARRRRHVPRWLADGHAPRGSHRVGLETLDDRASGGVDRPAFVEHAGIGEGDHATAPSTAREAGAVHAARRD